MVSQSETQTCVRDARLMRLSDATYRESLSHKKREKSTFYQDALLTIHTPNNDYFREIVKKSACRGLASKSDECRSERPKRRRTSVSRTAFTRIHRDALPTVRRRENMRRKARNAHARTAQHTALPSVRASTRTSDAFRLTHRGETRIVCERLTDWLAARSLQRVQREG